MMANQEEGLTLPCILHPNLIPIVNSFSDSPGCLGWWPVWCLWERYFLGPRAPSPRSNTCSHQGTGRLPWDSSVCPLVLIYVFSLRHACIPLRSGNRSRWDLWNWILRFTCKCYWQVGRKITLWVSSVPPIENLIQQNVESLELMLSHNCHFSLLRKRSEKERETWAMPVSPFRTPVLLLQYLPTPAFLSNLWLIFTLHPVGGSHVTWLIEEAERGQRVVWKKSRLGPAFVHPGRWNSDSQLNLGPDENGNNKRSLLAYYDASRIKTCQKSDRTCSRTPARFPRVVHRNHHQKCQGFPLRQRGLSSQDH